MVVSKYARCRSSQAWGENRSPCPSVAVSFTAGPGDCSSTRDFSALKSRQPTWRANRETVALEISNRWASCPMEENRKVSVLVLI